MFQQSREKDTLRDVITAAVLSQGALFIRADWCWEDGRDLCPSPPVWWIPAHIRGGTTSMPPRPWALSSVLATSGAF